MLLRSRCSPENNSCGGGRLPGMLVAAALAWLIGIACDASYFELPDGGGGGAAHTHDPLFGGVLHEVGDHFAHLELLFDGEIGVLTLYVLDAHATGVVKVPEESLTIRIDNLEPAADENTSLPLRLTLEPQESLLGDERPGHASAFYALVPELRSATRFEGVVEGPLTIRGQTFTDIKLRYPEGTEPTD